MLVLVDSCRERIASYHFIVQLKRDAVKCSARWNLTSFCQSPYSNPATQRTVTVVLCNAHRRWAEITVQYTAFYCLLLQYPKLAKCRECWRCLCARERAAKKWNFLMPQARTHTGERFGLTVWFAAARAAISLEPSSCFSIEKSWITRAQYCNCCVYYMCVREDTYRYVALRVYWKVINIDHRSVGLLSSEMRTKK